MAGVRGELLRRRVRWVGMMSGIQARSHVHLSFFPNYHSSCDPPCSDACVSRDVLFFFYTWEGVSSWIIALLDWMLHPQRDITTTLRILCHACTYTDADFNVYPNIWERKPTAQAV